MNINTFIVYHAQFKKTLWNRLC